jgi:hypothetical protein
MGVDNPRHLAFGARLRGRVCEGGEGVDPHHLAFGARARALVILQAKCIDVEGAVAQTFWPRDPQDPPFELVGLEEDAFIVY